MRCGFLLFVLPIQTHQGQDIHTRHVKAVSLSQTEVFEPQFTNGRAVQIHDRVTEAGKHAPYLPLLPLVEGDLDVVGSQLMNVRRLCSVNGYFTVHFQFNVNAGS